jgi:tRNA threonylcarbamoyl adenosine modification protein YeaZ
MKILALDFSSPQRSVAVLTAQDAVAHEVLDSSPGRDMKPFALIEAVLRQAGLEREAIECLAIGLGPGSYTGIRVAVSLAQGWQLATGVKLLGVSSVECIAAQAVTDGANGKFSVVIDAQRGEFYLASYEAQNGDACETAPLRLATRAEVEERERAGDQLIGPEVTRWFPNGRIVFPQAATLARLAFTQSDFLPGEKLDPIYLRETTFVKAPPTRPLPFAL